MDLRHWRRFLVQESKQPRLEAPLVDDFLLPLSLEAVEDRVARAQVAGIDVAAHAQRVLLAQSPLRRRAQPVRQQVAVSLAQHNARTDLPTAKIRTTISSHHAP